MSILTKIIPWILTEILQVQFTDLYLSYNALLFKDIKMNNIPISMKRTSLYDAVKQARVPFRK